MDENNAKAKMSSHKQDW